MQDSKDELRPNFFQCPNALVDKYMAELSGSDLKCYLVVLRKSSDKINRISSSQFMKITGLSNHTVIGSCRNLVNRGLIIKESDDFGNNLYSLPVVKGFKPAKKGGLK
jgi:hypothetical protein